MGLFSTWSQAYKSTKESLGEVDSFKPFSISRGTGISQFLLYWKKTTQPLRKQIKFKSQELSLSSLAKSLQRQSFRAFF